jgi:hypothetical protein
MQAFPGQAAYRSHPNGIASVNRYLLALMLAGTNKSKINHKKLPNLAGIIVKRREEGMCGWLSVQMMNYRCKHRSFLFWHCFLRCSR